MSVTANDIVVYGSQVMAEEDTTTNIGGAIDLTTRVVFDDAVLVNDPTASGGDGTVRIASSDPLDTNVIVNIFGRSGDGVIASGNLNLDGSNATITVTGTNVYERLLKVETGDHSGTIVVRDSNANNIMNIESGVTAIRRPFYDVSANAVGGSEKNYYEKVFIKNNNDSNALLSAQISESADPSGAVTFELSSGVDDSADNGAFTRQTIPTTGLQGGGFDSDAKNVPGTNLGTENAIGVWLELKLPAGTGAGKTTYTLNTSGNTT